MQLRLQDFGRLLEERVLRCGRLRCLALGLRRREEEADHLRHREDPERRRSSLCDTRQRRGECCCLRAADGESQERVGRQRRESATRREVCGRNGDGNRVAAPVHQCRDAKHEVVRLQGRSTPSHRRCALVIEDASGERGSQHRASLLGRAPLSEAEGGQRSRLRNRANFRAHRCSNHLEQLRDRCLRRLRSHEAQHHIGLGGNAGQREQSREVAQLKTEPLLSPVGGLDLWKDVLPKLLQRLVPDLHQTWVAGDEMDLVRDRHQSSEGWRVGARPRQLQYHIQGGDESPLRLHDC
mmetsp:Transcript_92732/g.261863  ORF Transcript_92732/g.261863 Transcript_92732/m.261863 type:complete len:296 (+) Transcript_92732:279-1166(+)